MHCLKRAYSTLPSPVCGWLQLRHSCTQLFIQGLRYDTNETPSKAAFEKYGEVTKAKVIFRSLSAKSRSSSSSSPSLSIWRRRKEMGKEGLMVVKELKRLQRHPVQFEQFMKNNVSRLLKADIVAVLNELQRQNLVSLSMKMYNVVRNEIWYRPDMFFYRDMLIMLARNKKVDDINRVWNDSKKEDVMFDQHTFGDLIRSCLDNGLTKEAMLIYDEMRCSSDTPQSLSYRVILKGLIRYPELRDKVKDDFMVLFPGMIVYDPPDDLVEDERSSFDSEEDDDIEQV